MKKIKKVLDKLPNLCYNNNVNKNKSHSRKELMTMEKMTNVKAINYVLDNCEVPADVKEKLEKMREQFVKKNSAERKPTANQVENQGYKADILAYLGTVESATITDLMKAVPSLAELSNQRVSAIVRQLKDSGEVVREEIKRKAYFSIATAEVEE